MRRRDRRGNELDVFCCVSAGVLGWLLAVGLTNKKGESNADRIKREKQEEKDKREWAIQVAYANRAFEIYERRR